MLFLFTGLPGTGKTLNLIKYVHETKTFEGRPIYYYGIDNCNVEGWTELSKEQVIEWYSLPEGSIILIDEAQKLWRVRGSSTAIPQSVQELETHRHLGMDILLTSQFPMQLDKGVRELVQYHKHFERPANFKTGRYKQWEECVDPKKPNCTAIDKGKYILDKKYFDCYKSAEVHTHGARIPKKLITVGILIVCTITFIIYAFNSVLGRHTSEPLINPDFVSSDISSPRFADRSSPGIDNFSSRLSARSDLYPYSAPIYDSLIEAIAFPRITGCMHFSTKVLLQCKCTTQQGTTIAMPEKVCLTYIASGGQFDFSKPDIDMDKYMSDYLPTGDPCCGSSDNSSESTQTSQADTTQF